MMLDAHFDDRSYGYKQESVSSGANQIIHNEGDSFPRLTINLAPLSRYSSYNVLQTPNSLTNH